MTPNPLIKIYVPSRIQPLFTTKKRYVSIYGGRGSGKSWSVALFLLLKAMDDKIRVLCTREIQNSIKDSVHKLLGDTISRYKLDAYFEITDKTIKSTNGSEFLFKGLRHNPNDIKSTEGIDYCWIEEAHSVSRKSFEILTPTIRKPGSQIIFTYNPTNEDDPVHVDYTLADREDVEKILVNCSNNMKFPEVLKGEMEYDKRVDFDKYLHIWEGHCVKHSEAQIFYGKWRVEDFETPEGVIFYHGSDWGFSTDPSAAIRCYVGERTLYIDYDAYGVGVDIDKTGELFDRIPNIRRHKIIADSARPETISYLSRQGFNIVGARKGKGSVEDGIEFIRSFEDIIIHPRCQHTIDEFRNYCWKVDKNTGEISTVPMDAHNHLIDALRYALEDIMRHKTIKPSRANANKLGF
jgi:phage terminase large subunit